MSPKPNKQLDRLLAEWSHDRSVSAEDLQLLQKQIGDGLTDDKELAAELLSETSASAMRLAAFGLAASLMIAVGFWQYYARQRDVFKESRQIGLAISEYDGQAPVGIFWSPADVENQGRLLAEYQAVFEKNVAWVADTNGHCDVGLLPKRPATTMAHDGYVAIRLVLWSRLPQEQWKQVQVCNVLVSREELVEISTTNGEETRLAIWAYPIDKDMISIDLRYQPPGLAGLEIESCDLLRRRQSANIRSFEQDGVEYQLFQIAEVLANDDLG